MVRVRIISAPSRPRGEAGGPARRVRPYASLGLTVLVGFAAVLVAPAIASSGGNTATVAANLNLGTLSVTVSPPTVTYGGCVDSKRRPAGGYLQFPNGQCSAPTSSIDGTNVITITNGTAESIIDVQGAPAVPTGDSNASDAWTLVESAPASNSVNVYEEGTGAGFLNVPMSTSPTCDHAIQNCLPGAVDLPNKSSQEGLYMVGPGSSSSSVSKFTTTVTWTAVAP